MHKLRRTCCSDSVLTPLIVFSLLYIISCISLSIYAKLSNHVLAIRERESGCKYAMNCVYLSKIENSSYYQELDL